MVTFDRGERLTARKMNRLAQDVYGNYAVDDMGHKGPVRWQEDEISKIHPRYRSRYKPFDIQCEYVNDVLSSYDLTRCEFYDGSSFVSIPDAEVTHENVRSISQIDLCELSSSVSSTLPLSVRWQVIDDISQALDFPQEDGLKLSVLNAYRLYGVDDGTIVDDMRDAFVQVGGNSIQQSSEPYGVFRFTPNTGTISTETDPAAPCGTFTMCNVVVGRNSYSCGTEISGIYDGTWWVRLNHTTMSCDVLENTSSASETANTLYQTCLKICRISNQAVYEDFRSNLTFVVYE